MTTKLLSRREMLHKSTAMATLTTAQVALPHWMPRLAFAPLYDAPRGDVLVTIFLRGGADALNMIVPHGDDAYYAARPRLAIPRPDTLSSDPKTTDLDGFFGLHPALASLAPIFNAGELVAVHATGSPHPTRSHFEAMDFMERGAPGNFDVATGWMGRHLATLNTGNNSPIRAVGWGTAAQTALRGPVAPIALQSIADYHLGGRVDIAEHLLASLHNLYTLDGETLHTAATATQSALAVIASVDIANYVPQHGAVYPEIEFAFGLQQTAALIRADVGLEAAAIDLGGWDTHVNQGAVEGTQARLLSTLADGLAAFHADLGPDLDGVTVVVMSEFGRRLAENGGSGTDHGHGGALLIMSGNLDRSPIVADWPGLQPEALDRGDLAITIDYRDILSDLLQHRLNNPSIAEIFPDFTPQGLNLFQT